MTRSRMERRALLKAAAQGMLAVPALTTFGSLGCMSAPRQNAQSAAANAPALPGAGAGVKLNVRDYGATGDGATKDTLALQLTIERCSVFGGGEVVVPAGDYLTGALALRSGVTLRLEEGATLHGSPDMADYPFAQVRWEGHWIKGYIGLINATDAENIALLGPGKVMGSEAVKGRVERPGGLRLPALIEFNNCRNVRVEDLKTEQFGMWSTHPVYSENVTFRNVSFKSGADGVDVDSCRHVVIDGCTFDTGDDCISLKSGRGAEGNLIGRVCEDVTITNCTLADAGFACIGIGSETSAGVRNVRVERCRMVHARSHAIYIKSRVGRGAFVKDISVSDCDVSGTGQGFLRINDESSGKTDGEESVIGEAGVPEFGNFRFSNIRVTDVPVLVQGTESNPLKPLDGLVLENITGTCQKGISLANMKNVVVKNIHVTGFEGPLLETWNVTGKGLEGAAPLDAAKLPKAPDPVPVPATAYKLH